MFRFIPDTCEMTLAGCYRKSPYDDTYVVGLLVVEMCKRHVLDR